MVQKSAAQKVFLGVELVAALRILLFTVPVLLHGVAADARWEHHCMVLLTACSALFAVVAVLSLAGVAAWRMLNGAAIALTFLGGAVFLNQAFSAEVPVPGLYYFPVALAVLAGAGMLAVTKKVPAQ